MLNTMINGESSFVEKKERKVKVPFSSHAVEMVVKYMYGIELEDLENPNALLELIEMGGLNGIENLDKAAAEMIKPHVKKENVFQILSFAHLYKADGLKKICGDVIFSTFSEEEVLEQKVIIDCPEMGVELWQLFKNKQKALPRNRRSSSEDTMIYMPAQKMLSKPVAHAPALQEQDQSSEKSKICENWKDVGLWAFYVVLVLLLIGCMVIGGLLFPEPSFS